MPQSIDVKVDLSQLAFGVMAEDAAAAVRPAARAGALVIYEQVKRNVSKIKVRTGTLSSSIYHAYNERESRPGAAQYDVGWNPRKARHGHLLEFGHLQRYKIVWDKQAGRFVTLRDQPLPVPVRVAARPFVRPAMVVIPNALQAAEDRFIELMREKGHL